MHATVDEAFALPVADPLTVRAALPITVSSGVTDCAHFGSFVERVGARSVSRQLVSVFRLMAVEAPDATRTMVEGLRVGRDGASFGIGRDSIVTGCARVKFNVLSTRNNVNRR